MRIEAMKHVSEMKVAQDMFNSKRVKSPGLVAGSVPAVEVRVVLGFAASVCRVSEHGGIGVYKG